LYSTFTQGPNIALGKNAAQGPDTFSSMWAGNAVNDVTFNDNIERCAHTTQGNTTYRAWWQVDLGDAYRITGIKIFNRKRDGNNKWNAVFSSYRNCFLRCIASTSIVCPKDTLVLVQNESKSRM